ncbi:MAG: anthranilate synthase component I family protein [Crocinitomicaceae bacterium]|nr:anthranilate synthase component I family protein [Crocinitomicaceae bacterium]
MTTQIYSYKHNFNADVFTPVELYLRLRHKYRKTCLLESNDYYSRQESHSFIGLEPIVEVKLTNRNLTVRHENQTKTSQFREDENIVAALQNLISSYGFQPDAQEFNGFFGRMGFEMALLTETTIPKKDSDLELPDFHFYLYKYVLVIDHFKDEGTVIKNSLIPEPLTQTEINILLEKKPFANLPFEKIGQETGDLDNEAIQAMVEKAQDHIRKGDVFQLVLSNRYQQAFFGDDFNVYRSLRRLNPSPYLFYFDFEDYHLFGSSPEAQLKISKGIAEIHPIAGTVRKTGDFEVDEANISKLKEDEKENAEHTMLVDLARNDLSRSCKKVFVDKYKQIQAFSHVYHLVSVVKGELEDLDTGFQTFNETFPAGTLSGTPKPKALELIAKMENTTRDFYGGAIGLLGANGDLNMAIVIRSILSKNGYLYYRAGAGVVLDSTPEGECEEIHNKLMAVRKAIEKAGQVEKQILELL